MTLVDGVIEESEVNLVAKYGIKLGFDVEEAHGYEDIIYNMLRDESHRDEFLEELM